MSKTKTSITRNQVFNLFNAITALAKNNIGCHLRYAIAKNRPALEAEIRATQEAIGPEPAADDTAKIAARNETARKMGEENVEIDLHKYLGVPMFNDLASFPNESDSVARNAQNQAIMDAIIPMLDNEDKI